MFPPPDRIVFIEGTLVGMPMGLLELTNVRDDCSEDSKSIAEDEVADIDDNIAKSSLSLYRCKWPRSRWWW